MEKIIKDKNILPIGWLKTTVGEICHFEYGKALKKERRNENGQFHVFGSNGKVGYHDKFLVKGPCIIIGRKGTAGSVNFSYNDCWPIDTTYFIRNYNNLNIKYLYYQLIKLDLSSLEKSTAIPGLNRNDAYEKDLYLAPLNEQNRIAQKLDELFRELDKANEQLQAALEQIKVFRQTVLQRAFEGKITEEWRKKQKSLKTPKEIINEINAYRQVEYHRKLEEFNDGNSKIRPKERKKITTIGKAGSKNINTVYVRLGDIFETTSGGTPSRDNPGYYSGEIPWVKSGELKNNTIYKTEEKITQEALDNSSAKLFPKGTLLVAMYGATVGKLAFLGIEASTNQAVCGIFEMPFYNLRYLYFYLLYIRPELIKQSAGGAQPNISQTILNNQFIPLCSIEEQQEVVKQIDELFSTADLMENNIVENIQRSEGLKDELLDRAFEGKLVDQDPNDESASILLEKIKKEREELMKVELERKKIERSYYIKDIEMTEVLKSILEILKERNEPIHAKTLWQLSVHKGDIDEFYAEIKKLMESGEIEESERVGKDSFIKLTNKR